MNSRSKLIIIIALVVTVTLVGFGILGFFLFGGNDGGDDTGDTYEIVLASYIEVYIGRSVTLSPEVLNSAGEVVPGRFEYEYDHTYISIDKSGKLEAIDPTYNGEVSVRIIDKKTGTEKTFTVRVVSEVSAILEIRDQNGNAIGSDYKASMEIGESYVYEVITMPSAAAIEEYTSVVARDIKDAVNNVFDVKIEANRITLTAIGIGEGVTHFSVKNADRHLDYSLDMSFEISFPDLSVNEAVKEKGGVALISSEELSKIDRLEFPADVGSFSTDKMEHLRGLSVIILDSDTPVSITGLDALPEKIEYRVPSKEVYLLYREEEAWQGLINNVLPYASENRNASVTLHNEEIYTVSGKVLVGGNIVEKSETVAFFTDENKLVTLSVGELMESGLPVYELLGYDFIGWRDVNGNTFDKSDLIDVKEGIHIYALWAPKTHKIVFEDESPLTSPELEVTYKQPIGTLEPAEKKGWSFQGWYTDKDYTTRIDGVDGLICLFDEDITLYAKYAATLKLDSMGLKDASGNSLDRTVEIVYGKTVPALSERPDASSTWLMDAGAWTPDRLHLSDEVYGSETPYVREGEGIVHTLYVTFTRTVSFEGLEVIESIKHIDDDITSIKIYAGLSVRDSLKAEGLYFDSITVKTRGAWEFIGWTTTAISTNDSDELFFADGLLMDAELELAENENTLYPVCRGTLEYNYGPSAINNPSFLKTVYYGFSFTLPELSEHSGVDAYAGYSFIGWYDGAGDVAALNKVEAERDGGSVRVPSHYAGLKVYAKYTADAASVTFKNNKGDIISVLKYYYSDFDINDNVVNDKDDGSFEGRRVIMPALTGDGLYRVGYTAYWTADNIAGERLTEGDIWTGAGYQYDHSYGDMIFYPVYTANKYTVSFESLTANSPTDKIISFDEKYGDMPIPEDIPEGYEFIGWFTDTKYENNNEITRDTVYTTDKDTVLYARYTKEIKFGEKSYTVIYNSSDTLSVENPSFGNWIFTGWYNGDELLGAFDNGVTEIKNYTANVDEYRAFWTGKLTLDFTAGNSVQSTLPAMVITINYGKSLADIGESLPENDGHEGWSIRWYSPNPTGERVYIDNNSVYNTNNMTLYAEYSTTVTVKYHSVNAQDPDKTHEGLKVYYGDNVLKIIDELYKETVEGAFLDSGYCFTAWRLIYGSSFKDYTPGAENTYPRVTFDMANAFIESVRRANYYMIELDLLGGDIAEEFESETEFDVSKKLPSTVSLTGYIFKGWRNTLTNEIYAPGAVVSGLLKEQGAVVKLCAIFDPISYKVTLDLNGGTLDGDAFIDCKYDENFTLPVPTRRGYSFEHWIIKDTTDEYEANEDIKNLSSTDGAAVELVAVYKKLTYTVSFENLLDGKFDEKDGITDNKITAAFDTALELALPTRAGYTFAGWFLEADFVNEVKNASDLHLIGVDEENNAVGVTVYAKWVPVSIKITLNTEGGEFDQGLYPGLTDEYYPLYDSGVQLPASIRLGYTFTGWLYIDAEGKESNPTTVTELQADAIANGGVTLTATWVKNNYTVIIETGIPEGIGDTEIIYNAIYDESLNITASRQWYTLLGFSSTAGGNVVYPIGEEGYATVINLAAEEGGEARIYAVWQANEYEIRYEGIADRYTATILDTSYPELVIPGMLAHYTYSWSFGDLPFGNEALDDKSLVGGDGVRYFEVKINKVAVTYRLDIYDAYGNHKYSIDYTVDKLDNLDGDHFTSVSTTKPGYSFISWVDGLGNEVDPTELLASLKTEPRSVTVSPRIEALEYTIVFKLHGESLKQVRFTLDDSTIPSVPSPVTENGYIYTWVIEKSFIMSFIEMGETEIPLEAQVMPISYSVLIEGIDGADTYTYNILSLTEGTLSLIVPRLPDGYVYKLDDGTVLSAYDDNGTYKLSVPVTECRDLNIIASKVGTVSIIFDIDGEKTTVEIAPGAVITPPSGYERIGYKLAWYYGTVELLANMTPEELTGLTFAGGETVAIKASYSPILYYVELDANGGDIADAVDNIAYYGVKKPLSSNVTREGYIFLGWRHGDVLLTPDAIGQILALDLSSVEGEAVTLTAEWKAITYNVVFDTNGQGSVITPVLLTYDEKLTLPLTLTKIGYSLMGWSHNGTTITAAEASRLSSIDGDTVTLVAVWEPIRYTLEFVGGVDTESIVITYGETVAHYPTSVRPGYMLYGWYYYLDGKKVQVVGTGAEIPNTLSTVDGDAVKIYADWRQDIIYLVYGDGGESSYSDSVIFFNERVPVSKDGFVTGWLNYDLTEKTDTFVTEYVEGSIADGWIRVTYIYTYEGNELLNYRIYKPGELERDAVAPAIPKTDGYASEWVYLGSGEEGYTARVALSRDENDSYTLIFNTMSGTAIEDMKLYFGDKLDLSSLDVKDYNSDGSERVLLGWLADGVFYSRDSFAKPVNINENRHKELVITAVFEYSITYSGSDFKTTYSLLTHREEVLTPDIGDIIPRRGYIGEWIVPTLTNGDITVHPIYTPITFTISVDFGNGEQADITVIYGEDIFIKSPTRPKERFVGWMYDGRMISLDEMPTLSATNGDTLKIEAVFTDKIFKADFTVDGEIYETVWFGMDDIGSGKLLMVSSNPPARAHYYAAWEDYTLTPADLVIEAKYTPVVYKINYFVGSVVIHTEYYTVEGIDGIEVPALIMRDGYTARWNDTYEADFIGNKDIHIEYTAKEYTVTYYDRFGALNESFTVKYDESFTLPSVHYVGYTFLGFERLDALYTVGTELKISELAPEGADVSFTEKVSANTYYFNFYLDKDKTILLDPAEFTLGYTLEDDISELLALFPGIDRITKISGYDAAWTVPDELKVIVLEDGTEVGMDIYPVYTETVYYVVFKKGDNIISTKEWTVTSGAVSEPPIASGFVWRKEAEDGSFVDYELAPESFVWNEGTGRYELVLHNKEEDLDHQYKVEFKDGSSLISTKYFGVGSTIILPSVPTKTGYISQGWIIDEIISLVEAGIIEIEENGSQILIKSINGEINGITTIYANYTPIKYTVVYEMNGSETVIENSIFEYDLDGNYVSSIVPTRFGYTFTGFEIGGRLYQAGDRVDVNLSDTDGDTVYANAVFVPIGYGVDYTVLGEKLGETVELKFDELLTLLTEGVPTPIHKEFLGWSLEENGAVLPAEVSGLTGVDGEIVSLYAVFGDKEYTVTFTDGENEYIYYYTAFEGRLYRLNELSEKVYFDAPEESPAERKHYDAVFGEVALDGGNKTVFVLYTPKTYKATFLDGSDIIAELEYTYGDTALDGVPAVPVREHYTSVWSEYDVTLGGDITVSAVHTAVIYKVVFYSNTEGDTVLYETEYSLDNKDILIPAIPHGFAGWDMPVLDGGDKLIRPVGAGADGYYTVTFVDSRNNTVTTVAVKSGEGIGNLPVPPAITGYTAAWETIPESITSDTVIRPVYTVIEYTVNFYASPTPVTGEEPIHSVKYTVENTAVSAIAPPSRTHYDVVWDVDLTALTYGDVDVRPVYTPVVYTVIFYASHPDKAQQTEAYRRYYTIENQVISIPAVPELTGYENPKWESFDLSVGGDISVYAIYVQNVYNVNFVVNGTATPSVPFEIPTALTDCVYDLTTVTMPVLNHTGWVFSGVWTDQYGNTYTAGQNYSNLTDKNGETLILTTELRPIRYTVKFTITVESGSTVYLPDQFFEYDVTKFTLPGYDPGTGYWELGYWKHRDQGYYKNVGTELYNETTVDGDVIYLDGKCSKRVYTVTLHPEGGSVSPESIEVKHNEVYGSALPTPTRGNVSGDGGYTSYTFAGWDYENTGIIVNGDNVVFNAADHNLYAKWTPEWHADSPDNNNSCLVKGTLIMLPDGSYTAIENLKVGDAVMTFNHETGAFEPSIVAFTFYANTETTVTTLEFSNGETLGLANTGHSLFDLTLGKYVLVSPDNVSELVGHSFSYMSLENGVPKYSDVVLVDYDIKTEMIERYDIATANNINHIANGMLACSDTIVGFCNTFDFREDLRYDEEKKLADIEKYGVFTYEEWSEYVTKEQFEAFHGEYFKIAIAKGTMTEAELYLLITDLNTWDTI